MPKRGHNKKGNYVAFGHSKHYYRGAAGRKRATKAVIGQEIAASYHGYHGPIGTGLSHITTTRRRK